MLVSGSFPSLSHLLSCPAAQSQVSWCLLDTYLLRLSELNAVDAGQECCFLLCTLDEQHTQGEQREHLLSISLCSRNLAEVKEDVRMR